MHSFVSNPGKGFIFALIYPSCYKSFSVINFTNSKTILEFHDILAEAWIVGRRTDYYELLRIIKEKFRQVGEFVQPCISQFVFFLIEAYARQDFETAYDYLVNGEKRGTLTLTHPSDVSLVRYFQKTRGKGYKVDDGRKQVLAKLIIVHFDNLLDLAEALKKRGIRPLKVDIFRSDVLEKYDIQSEYVDFVRFIRQRRGEYGWYEFLVKLLKEDARATNVVRSASQVVVQA
jgi:hypothetical protein